MKRHLPIVIGLLGAAVLLALSLGSVLSHSKAVGAAYRRGWSEAISRLQREAVREGHGVWERVGVGQPNRFVWLPVRTQYKADRPANLPIDKLFPESAEPSLIRRLLQ